MSTNCLSCYPGRLTLVLTALAALFGLGLGANAAGADKAPDRLTSRSRPPLPKVQTIPLGKEIQTRAGQRRRFLLPGGAVLYVNHNTTVKLDSARQATLSAGEVFMEADSAQEDRASFTIKTPSAT